MVRLPLRPLHHRRRRRLDLQRFCPGIGLPSDMTIQVGDVSFHLHKFPLLSRCGAMGRLMNGEALQEGDGCVIQLHDLPGGAKAFELVAKFCYGVKLELTPSNVLHLRCAAEHLGMTEEHGERNLVSRAEVFLTQVVLRSWKDTLKALHTLGDLVPRAEDLHVVERCIQSLAVKACTDPNIFGWTVTEHGSMESTLWNGIDMGASPRNSSSDWWYEDVSCLSLPIYKRLISVMGSCGFRQETIAGSLAFYARRYLPGLGTHLASGASTEAPSEEEQIMLLDEMANILPRQKGAVSTKFLFSLLRTAITLKASPTCMSNLEMRIGMQLDQATLEDLVMPISSYFSAETTPYITVDCVGRILGHFLAMDWAATGGASPCLAGAEQLPLSPITSVAALVDGYLAEVARDVNLKFDKFQSLAAAVPRRARLLDDELYRSIDIYLKAHPQLTESETEQLRSLVKCRKLSMEPCTTHAVKERLTVTRVAAQARTSQKLQLRAPVAGRDGSLRPCRGGLVGDHHGWVTAVRKTNHTLKVGMDEMRTRVWELEEECWTLKQELDKLQGKGRGWTRVLPRMFSFKKIKMCGARGGPVCTDPRTVGATQFHSCESILY